MQLSQGHITVTDKFCATLHCRLQVRKLSTRSSISCVSCKIHLPCASADSLWCVRCDMLCCALTGADLKTVAAALKPAKELRWLVLRTAGVIGELSCDIILPSLNLLSLTRNGITVSSRFLCGLPSNADRPCLNTSAACAEHMRMPQHSTPSM